jgi:hypothetical protein
MTTRMVCLAVIGLWTTFVSAQTITENLTAIAIHRSLRDVINTGADLFNLQGDHAGCYRLYQGSLLAIRPMTSARQQADISRALDEADKKTSFADKAHRLRDAIDALREQLVPTAPRLPPGVVHVPPGFELIPAPPKQVK